MSRSLVQFESGVKLLRRNKNTGISLLFGDTAPGGNEIDDKSEPGSIYFATNGRLYQKRDGVEWTKFAQELSEVVDVIQEVLITGLHLSEKRIELDFAPSNPGAVRIIPIGGLEQFIGLQFRVSGKNVILDGLEEGLIVGDRIQIFYRYTRSEEPPAIIDWTEEFIITADQIMNKKILLSRAPASPSSVRLVIYGGIEQINGIQYRVNGQHILWDGLGLDGQVPIGDRWFVFYSA